MNSHRNWWTLENANFVSRDDQIQDNKILLDNNNLHNKFLLNNTNTTLYNKSIVNLHHPNIKSNSNLL